MNELYYAFAKDLIILFLAITTGYVLGYWKSKIECIKK
jgi:hypothetical protein